jgi:putative flippase GtrA
MLRLPSKTFLRFAAVGAVNTLLGISLFPLLYLAVGDVLNVNIILTVSYILCTLSAFTLHKFITFGSEGKAHHEGIKFILVTGVLWAINVVLLNIILALIVINPIIPQTVIAVSLQLGNYVVLKRFVFSGKRATSLQNDH